MRSDAGPTLLSETYPTGTVRALIESDLVTPATRAVLLERLDPGPAESTHGVFDSATSAILRAVCARLIPQPDRAEPIDLAAAVEERLASGKGNGWRYAAMPPDAEAYERGLRAVDECAQTLFGESFVSLDERRADDTLRAVQRGDPPGPGWTGLPSELFFEELLAEVVECYYSHPLAQEEIGYAGFADAHGWQALGLDQLAAHEPRPQLIAGDDADADASWDEEVRRDVGSSRST